MQAGTLHGRFGPQGRQSSVGVLCFNLLATQYISAAITPTPPHPYLSTCLSDVGVGHLFMSAARRSAPTSLAISCTPDPVIQSVSRQGAFHVGSQA